MRRNEQQDDDDNDTTNIYVVTDDLEQSLEHIEFSCQALSRFNQLGHASSLSLSDQVSTSTDSTTSEIQLS